MELIPWGADSHTAFQSAFAIAAAQGYAVYVPAGVYRVTASALTYPNSDYPLHLTGDGAQITQIWQMKPNTDLLLLGTTKEAINGWYIGHLTVCTVAGSGKAIVLMNCCRGTMEDVQIPRTGYDGMDLRGGLLNTFRRVRISTNLPHPRLSGLFGGPSHAGIWMEREEISGTSSNGNSLVGCVIEGGAMYGIVRHCPHGYP